MNTNKQNDRLPYNPSDALSIFEYSKGLLGKTLRDFVWDGYKPKSGKGGLGQMVENIYFLLETNNNPEADFSKAGMELKCTPLKRGDKDSLLIKERLVCNMINYCEVVNETFETSHFFLKCQLMLIMFYLHIKDANKLDLEFLLSILWRLPQKDLIIIKHDYEVIINKIKNGKAHELSEGDTMYLGACRKGQKGDSLMKQPYSEKAAPRRAFSLKTAYLRTILQYAKEQNSSAICNFDSHLNSKELVSVSQLKKRGFEDVILSRILKFKGKNYLQISKILDLSPSKAKHKYFMISNGMVSNKIKDIDDSEEFKKAGITLKTIRIEDGGTIKEAMSFENINYCDIADEENWYDSRLYEIFSGKFLFVVYKATGRKIKYNTYSISKKQNEQVEEKEYVLSDAFFWTMPQEDLEWAENYWLHIKETVLSGHVSEDYWWKQSDRKKFHVRPKAQLSKDLALTPQGTRAKKYCYWFNNDYVKTIINNREQQFNEK